MRYIFFLFLTIIAHNNYAQQTINVSKSHINFTATNLGLDVDGKIRGLSGNVQFNPENLAQSYFEVSVPVKMVNTGNNMRDEHLLEEEFFDVKKFPEIKYVSSKVEKSENGYITTGKLTIKGTTKECIIAFNYQQSTLSGTITINRNDYKIGGDGFLNTVGDEVKININCVLNN